MCRWSGKDEATLRKRSETFEEVKQKGAASHQVCSERLRPSVFQQTAAEQATGIPLSAKKRPLHC